MTIKGILWDMDGVLVDTNEFHYQAWSRTLALFQIPFSRELFHQGFGMKNWDMLSNLLGHPPEQALFGEINNQKEEIFRQVIHGQATSLPGTVESLRFLKSLGIPQAIASSAPQENIDFLVDELDIRDFFDAIVSADKMAGKPAPDVFLASAKAIGVPPQHCLAIEDSVMGVSAAKLAGMTCLAVTNTNPVEALHQADYVVDSLLHLDAVFWKALTGI
jgi:beta-phosphoglucomutase